ncbi:mechanosensitive ion channel [Paenibacillus larvae]|nr:mechanosensitive ion channel domain-containing protein [Paenibacillus larvae]MDT2235707.1 mechanosensitive ion channel [Paenibacillus larvae]
MNLAINDKALQSFLDSVKAYFLDPDRLMAVLFIVIKIALIYMVARILIRILTKVISHMVQAQKQSRINFDTRRTNTLGKLANNVITYTINFIAILLILGQLGLNLGPILAGAGVLGLAIGFGAQSLVKDVITGFFIIFEDQFAVGDIVQIDTFRGRLNRSGSG